jgi:hypothetical protein
MNLKLNEIWAAYAVVMGVEYLTEDQKRDAIHEYIAKLNDVMIGVSNAIPLERTNKREGDNDKESGGR